MKKPWFRAYTDMIDDEKLRLLAFEDRWHFVALLCCKRSDLLDQNDHPDLLRRKVSVKLGVQVRELEEIARRLGEVGLIDPETLQPIAWETRQYESDTSTERVRRFREKKKEKPQQKQTRNNMKRFSNVSVTPPDTDTESDTEGKSKKALSRFTPPTVDEVSSYCKERNNSVDPARFVDFYASKGWMVGKSKMKDWQAAVRNWERSESGKVEPIRRRKML